MTLSRRIRSILGGSVGNLVEWFDWYVYASFSLYFAASFFPEGDPTAQLLNTAAVFAVGFLVRPLGGWLLGWWADRHGRKSALLVSVWMMGGGSMMIALTPSYATIGVAAPILLVVARIVQGISVGGEYGASATYLSEMAASKRRGFWASWQYVTLVGGQLLALAVLILLQMTLTEAELNSWGWRIPFALGGLASLVAILLRRRMEETPSFEALTAAQRTDQMRRLLQHPRQILTVIGLTAGGTLAFYTFATYMQKYLANTAGFSKPQATMIAALSLCVFMVLQPLFGAMSDMIGRRRQLIAFGVIGMFTTVPLMQAIGTAATPMQALLLITAALTVNALYSSISGLVKAELFPADIRALGVGLPYAVAVALFGGTAEFVALKLKDIGHESWFFWYVTAAIAVSLVVYISMPETRDQSEINE
jgi:MFS transporter, MHS family, alpha-ketoglutarate permease